MARYIDADKLLEKAEEIEWFNDGTGYYDLINIVHKYDVETAPTADVVPRAEVAREIFEEIREKGKFNEPIVDYVCLSFEELAEIEKKYTREGTTHEWVDSLENGGRRE